MMNPLDIGVVAVVVLSAIFAFARGFVREALSIVAWVGAGAVTYFGFTWAERLVEAHAHSPLLAQVVAGFGLFIGSLVVLSILTGLVARAVHFAGLSPVDRTLGFVFGLARGAFIVCLAFLVLDLSMPQQNTWPDWIRDARSKPYLHRGADFLQSFLPQSLKTKSVDDMLAPLSPTQQAMKLMQPPGVAAPAAATPNYTAHDRQQLNRVIRATGQR